MNYGDSVSIQCNVPSGDLPIGIRWYFNGATINDPSVVVTNVGKRSKVLTIDSVTGWHAGNYSCEASNKPEVVHFTAELSSLNPPVQLWSNSTSTPETFRCI
ncbi:hypothetical protein pipiens_000011, partial [Culex pipiens pipiens]